MKAIRVHDGGARLEELPRPPVGPGEVLVRVRAAGVTPLDGRIREGVPGQDFAGDVEGSGERVFGFARGSYAEFVSARELARMPATADYRLAAALPTAGLTAYQIVFDVLRLSKDQRILIHGAGGGVGSLALQLARMRRARIFATASVRDASYLKGLGASRVIDYETERFEARAKDLDAVIDLVGGETLARSYALLRPGGVIVSTVGRPLPAELERRRIRGVSFLLRRDPAQLARLAALVDRGLLRPKIGQILPLAEAPRARELKARGRIVLEIG